jgi:hypothetical protein
MLAATQTDIEAWKQDALVSKKSPVCVSQILISFVYNWMEGNFA